MASSFLLHFKREDGVNRKEEKADVEPDPDEEDI